MICWVSTQWLGTFSNTHKISWFTMEKNILRILLDLYIQNSNGFIYSSDISMMNHMVLTWVIVLKGIHVLIPRNILLYMTGLWGCKLKILSWGDYPTLSRYVINVIIYVLRRGRERVACMALLVGLLISSWVTILIICEIKLPLGSVLGLEPAWDSLSHSLWYHPPTPSTLGLILCL